MKYLFLIAYLLALISCQQPPWNGDFPEPKAPYAFTWQNCGTSSDPIEITTLSVSPSPVVLGQNITVAVKAALKETIQNQTGYTIELKLWRKEGIWIDIPCLDNVGSCDYDLCSVAPQKPCPPILDKYGIPCYCPFKAGSYALPSTSLATHDPSISWLTSGSYSAQANIKNPQGDQMGCYLIYVQLG